MEERTYDVRVRRRRGRWAVSVPELPRDAPVVEVTKLANADAEMITELSAYLGVHPSTLSVRVPHPVKPKRERARPRLTHGLAQLAGAGVLLGGVYTGAGVAATLIAAGIGTVAVSAAKEAGWL